MKKYENVLNQLIKNKGVTAYEVSISTGISESTLSRILNKNTKPNIQNRRLLAEYFDVSESVFLNNESSDNLEINYDGAGVPIYDVGFTAGFVELFKDGNPALLGYLNTTEVKGSDMIVRVNGDSMQGVMDDGDWIGIKRISDLEVISYGNPYGIVTQDLQLLKYLYKSNIADNLLLKSENIRHPEFDLPIKKILELYIIKVVLPYSKIKTFI